MFPIISFVIRYVIVCLLIQTNMPIFYLHLFFLFMLCNSILEPEKIQGYKKKKKKKNQLKSIEREKRSWYLDCSFVTFMSHLFSRNWITFEILVISIFFLILVPGIYLFSTSFTGSFKNGLDFFLFSPGKIT